MSAAQHQNPSGYLFAFHPIELFTHYSFSQPVRLPKKVLEFQFVFEGIQLDMKKKEEKMPQTGLFPLCRLCCALCQERHRERGIHCVFVRSLKVM